MAELKKAMLTEIGADPKKPKDLSDPVEVQFNPTTLKLSLSNQAEGGKTQTKPQRQYLGSGSRTLSMDLVFDTADEEGAPGEPRSVRERTAMVERFALPRTIGKDKQAPPKARFEWGPLVVEGIVENVSIDIDHFAPNGTPLRAKVALTIREQDPSFELLESGAGANPAGDAPAPGGDQSGAPGTSGSGTDRVGTALAGESAADFAARMGLDPGAWRGLAAGLDATLSLDAGLEIGFSASLGASLGLGLTGGLSAGISASVSASFGLEADLDLGLGLAAGGQFGAQIGGGLSGGGSPGAGRVGGAGGLSLSGQAGTAGRPAAAGFNLSAAGGLGAAIESVKTVAAQASQGAARAAFADPGAPVFASATAHSAATTTGTPSAAASSSAAASPGAPSPVATPAAPGTAPAPARPGMPQQPRQPLGRTGLPAPGTSAAAPAPPKADPRAIGFGFGVPLRPTYREAARRRAQGDLGLPPTTEDPQVPPWRALPASAARSGSAGSAPKGGCACPPTKTRNRSGTGP